MEEGRRRNRKGGVGWGGVKSGIEGGSEGGRVVGLRGRVGRSRDSWECWREGGKEEEEMGKG